MYFLYTVLPRTSSHTWTKQGVDHALGWAQYCEEAVAHLRHRGSIQAALTKLVKQTQYTTSFRDLQRATCLLLKLLLQNQLLETSVREHVLAVSERVHGEKFVSHAQLAARQQQQHTENLLTILAREQHSSISLSVRVRLMLEAANKAEPGEVGVCLDKVAHHPATLQTCFKAALLEGENAGVRVGPAVVQWVQTVVTSPQHWKYRCVLGSLCSMSPHHQAKALANYPQLVMPLLECIHREALSLEPRYEGDECFWHPHGSTVLSWEDLVKFYAVLMNHKKKGVCVEEKVEGWMMLEGGAVWGDIVTQAKATSAQISHTSDAKPKRQKTSEVLV